MPFIKKLTRGTNTAQFASTLSILTSSGVPLVDAMKISSEVLTNDCLKSALSDATQKVSEGESLHASLDLKATTTLVYLVHVTMLVTSQVLLLYQLLV